MIYMICRPTTDELLQSSVWGSHF